MTTFENAKAITKMVVENYAQRDMVKVPMDNVVFDRLGEIPLLEMLMNLSVVTKEHVNGTTYDKKNFQMVMRIINGKLLMRGQDLVDRPDAYAWKTTKVLKAKNKKPLGFHSTEGAQNYAQVLSTIQNQYERDLFTDLLVNWSKDLLLIHTESENRQVIEVTEEMLMAGITAVPNSYDIEWPAEGATGVELTPIKVGDALVIEQCSFGTAFYVVQKEEYELTHIPA
ncbi:MAG: hypothetical protein J6C46_09070 [Clostridia bacterium]|nr:hypothetical protein [Clostridia bacterium]